MNFKKIFWEIPPAKPVGGRRKLLLEQFKSIKNCHNLPFFMQNIKNKTSPGRILFIVHDVYQDDIQMPLGPAYLASVLRLAGHEVRIYSQDVFHQSNKELAGYLDDNEFDVIG